MAVLVTGCAGYIGSVACKRLLESGYEVIGLDNLSTGFRKNVPEGVKFFNSSIGDETDLLEILRANDIDSVIHFAGYIQVGESVTDPKKYFDNNLVNNIKFLDTLINHHEMFKPEKPINFVFSSSAAVYGNPNSVPIKEDAKKEAINPYGETKLAFENVLKFYSDKYDLKTIALRYFNVCGAYGDYGECHDPETHLIPLVLDAALQKRDNIKIFGTDYPTADGTAIRDYVHVVDLADAHILALENLNKSSSNQLFKPYNLGYGKGFSVKEIISAVKKVTGKDFKVLEEGRRAGDPAELVADSTTIKKELSWKPKFNDIEQIVKDAYAHRLKFYENKKELAAR